MPKEAELLTMSEAAKRLHLHVNTLRKWSDAGRVQTVRRPGGGGYRRFEPAVIDRTRREMGIEGRLATEGEC